MRPKRPLITVSKRKMLSLTRFMEVLEEEGVFEHAPSRKYLLSLLDDGTLEGHKVGECWYLYLDSALAWVESLQTPMLPTCRELAAYPAYREYQEYQA